MFDGEAVKAFAPFSLQFVEGMAQIDAGWFFICHGLEIDAQIKEILAKED